MTICVVAVANSISGFVSIKHRIIDHWPREWFGQKRAKRDGTAWRMAREQLLVWCSLAIRLCVKTIHITIMLPPAATKTIELKMKLQIIC